MKYTFGGDVATTYAEYIDVAKGSTLVAEPGQTYEIRQAAGVTRPGAKRGEDGELIETGEHEPVELPLPPDSRWTAARVRTSKDKETD
ncbi:hypothetical protein [Actinomadura montaniterrae]|uniref:Uncharacterized protein n=1 Tax=Actinomadura montaniterrae TaxID=1803903 RepID=A0A6L3VX92_9ACTN|nr:hypothetical protein [Actinomadura montaniterrae]KAB2384756.1 hypothetical protein F9B16_09925 [Actinomadura montaniterrae]